MSITYYKDGLCYLNSSFVFKNRRYKDLEGHIYYHKNGLLHRNNGAAFEQQNRDKAWFFNGIRHREDGPAIERSYLKSWYLNGVEYKEKEYNQWLEKKKLNEKLQATLEPKYKEKKNKV